MGSYGHVMPISYNEVCPNNCSKVIAPIQLSRAFKILANNSISKYLIIVTQMRKVIHMLKDKNEHVFSTKLMYMKEKPNAEKRVF
jgi:hypothetical protein